MAMDSLAPHWLWVGFNCAVVVLLVIDTWAASQSKEQLTLPQALRRTAFYVSLGLIMNVLVYQYMGAKAGMEFLAAYLLEESLSVDNLFVFLVILKYFRVPVESQHRVLFLGVLGAILMRGVLIYLGIAAVSNLPWIMYVFGAILILSGLKMGSDDGDDVDPEKNFFVRLLRRFFPITKDYHGSAFFVMKKGRRMATPLLIVLIAIETTDLIFAMDSIPAVFGVTQNHFVAYTSNILAVLGLRAIYFALAGMMGAFRYLKYGLSAILVFIGSKMLLHHHYPVDTSIALGVIATLLAASVLASVLIPAPPEEPPAAELEGVEEEGI